jgi:hypothetical protein
VKEKLKTNPNIMDTRNENITENQNLCVIPLCFVGKNLNKIYNRTKNTGNNKIVSIDGFVKNFTAIIHASIPEKMRLIGDCE